MKRAYRIAAGSIMHESNSFSSEPATLADFTVAAGPNREATIAAWRANRNEIAGFLDGAAESGIEIEPAFYAAATPSGPVAHEAFEQLSQKLLEGLRAAAPFDGVLLALHGAMYSENFPHADEEIARRVRAQIGPDTPLILTHDFHANISPEIVSLCDALVGYQKNPHVDTWDRGVHAARLMARTVRGEVRPVQAIAKPPMLLNIVHQNTSAEPLRSITDASIELEKAPGVLAASVAGGYQYNDVPYAGPSVVVVTDGDKARAQAEADSLANRLWEAREATRLNLPDAAEAVKAALASDEYPVALFDPGDNIGGGSPGDETALLAELIRQNARGWVVALCDPGAVEAASRAGVGAAFHFDAGGKSRDSRTRPLPIRGRVRSVHDGRFFEPEVRHGGQRLWDMGISAVIEEERSAPEQPNLLLLTSHRCCPFSLGQLTSCGIIPERQRVLVVKGTIAPRAAYEPVCERIVLVDTPGVTAVNPRRFVFRRVRAGIWGLD